MSAPITDILAQEHKELRRAAQKARRDPVARTLGSVVMSAVVEAEQMQTAGADPDAVADALETVVRSHWPKPKHRTEPWHYVCQLCEDTGWQYHDCPGDATCGPMTVEKMQKSNPHAEHQFVTACWCEKGRMFAKNMLPKEKRGGDDTLASVGKTSKPTRWGHS